MVRHLGLLVGSCWSSFWMRFLARGPIREGIWYSFFLILHRKVK